MANLLNLDAESGANAIGDDSQPTFTFSNTGGSYGLHSEGLAVVSTASIDVAQIASLTANTTRPVSAANATVVKFNLTGSSIASGAVLGLLNNSAYVSATTINIGASAANVNGAFRVVLPNGTFGWVPVLANAAVSGTAV